MPAVLVTRASTDAGSLVQGLQAMGCQAVCVPLIHKVFHHAAVRATVWQQPHWHGLVLTSTAAVQSLATLPALPQFDCVAAVGPSTKAAAKRLGLSVQIVPNRHTASDLAAALGPLPNQVWLYPRAQTTQSGLADSLRATGAHVVEVIAYTNTAPPGWASALAKALPTVQVVTLLSGSAARRFAKVGLTCQPLPEIITIGPSTSRVVRKLGLPVAAMATPHTVTGVLDAVRMLAGTQPMR